MPRKPAPVPPYKLKVSLSQETMGRLTVELWSEVESRVPLGAYSEFVEARLRDHFASSRLDLATLVPGLTPGRHFVWGRAEDVQLLTGAQYATHP